MIRENVRRLIQALDNEKKVYEDVLYINRNKKEVLQAGDIKKLEDITKVEQKYIQTIIKLENEREKILAQLVKELKIRDIDSLLDLVDKLNPDEKQKLMESRNALKLLLSTVQSESSINQKLIQQSLDMVNLNIEMLTTNLESGTNYKSEGVSEEREKISLFDVRV